MFNSLQRDWHKSLVSIFQSANIELTISSPYISTGGAEFLLNNISEKFTKEGYLRFITDLSPRNIYQGSTEPKSFKLLFNSLNSVQIFHLPRLHAKVYISDEERAIITSGNLTNGGIYTNFEYGVLIQRNENIRFIKNDLLKYASLGSLINSQEINSYCDISEEIKKLYKQKEKTVKNEIEKKFRRAITKANDELVKTRLSGGALHTVFEKTILYLLQKNGPLPTLLLHNLIEEIHPDLCDNNVDRIINGVRFGKKWKHAVRTAQQHLKKKGIIELGDGKWVLTK